MSREVKETPNEKDILSHAYSLFNSGGIDEKLKAIDIVINTIDKETNIADAKCLLGFFFSELGEYENSVENYKECLNYDSSSPFARLGLAWLYMTGNGVQKDQEKALMLLQNADRNPGISIMIGLIRLENIEINRNTTLAKFNFLKAYSMGNLIGYRLLSRVFWIERRFLRAICIEVCAFVRILPIYLRNRHDIRIWAPWVDWIK